MNNFNFESSLDKLLREASEHLRAGRKDEARELLREALAIDSNNLETWELLWQAAYTTKEELSSLKHILKIDPRHDAAKKRLSTLQSAGVKTYDSQPLSRASSRRSSRKSRQQASTLLLLLGSVVLIACVGITGWALLRSGYVPFLFSSNLTATAIAERNASCQALIERTIQASKNYCDDTATNSACYGNNTLRADLAPNTVQRFSERGDKIPVDGLRRLSASPLNLDNNEWGIAVFKVVANLPRSLPGETVTMVVFGNSTLDNRSGDSESLEAFYFSSELGQIVCDKIPFDGLMISSPDGSGVRFSINGAELTLIGDASIKATKNGEMKVSVYNGSARIVANGVEQYVGAGQSSSVQLGGDNGTEAVSTPSEPETITGDELTMACTLTGEFCSPDEINPVSEEQAQVQIESAITSTPTLVPSPTITRTPSPTEPPTYTLVVLPPPTFTRTATRPPTPTSTPTKTPVPPATSTPTRTSTATPTVTGPLEPLCPSVSLSPLTRPNPNQLSVDITNNNGSTITINRFFAYWPDVPSAQMISQILLNGAVIWNISDPDTPSDIPAEGNWINSADLTIPDATTRNFLVQFSNSLQATGYEIRIVFDIGCQAIGLQ